ncbi:phenylacetyl-CoA ligase [Penicillium verhagenii]|nr:phenylacetyl-CoA ligase [Penicillium verhagenii]
MIDIPAVGVWELLFEQRQRAFPEKHVIFQSVGGKSYTYQDVRNQGKRFGTALRECGWQWKKSDVLMVMSPNSIETPAVIWGCLYAGGTVTPANPDLAADELKRQLVTSQTKVLVAHSECIKVAKEAIKTAKLHNIHLLVADGSLGDVQTVDEFIEEVEGNADRSCLNRTWTPINPALDVAYLVYSSGTTGYPKAVMISHRNVVAAVVLQAAVENMHVQWDRDRTLAVIPVYHIYGLICLLHLPVWLGISTIFMGKFEIGTFCRLIKEHAITHTYVAPPIVLHLAKSPLVDQHDIKSLRMMTSGGAPLSTALINELIQRRGLARWNDWSSGIGSNGALLPNLEARFVRPDGSTAVGKEEGELWIRGPTVFKGFLNQPHAAATCLSEDGWFKTGDIGYEDDRGNLYITDRAKDLIKFKGYQVAPAELEDLLLTHPAIEDAAVVGVMNPDLQSEVPLAYIRLKEGWNEDEGTAAGILHHVKCRVVHYKQLRGGIVWTPSIPKKGLGQWIMASIDPLNFE